MCFKQIEDLNLSMFNMITGLDKCKTLIKCTSCRFDWRKCNSDQWWNNDKWRCECKKRHACEKGYSWNPSKCNCENEKKLASIMDNLAITCDEIIDVEETNCNEKNVTLKHKVPTFYWSFY